MFLMLAAIRWGVLQWCLFFHPRFFFFPAAWQSVSVSFRSLGRDSSRLPYLARRVPPLRFCFAEGFLQRSNFKDAFSPPRTLVPGICWYPGMEVTLSTAGDQLMAAGRAVLIFPFLLLLICAISSRAPLFSQFANINFPGVRFSLSTVTILFPHCLGCV